MKIINNCGFAQAIFLTPKKHFHVTNNKKIFAFFFSPVFFGNVLWFVLVG